MAAANSVAGDVGNALAAAQRAEAAARQAGAILAEIQTLYRAMQEYVAQAVQAIQAEGKTQLERITTEGTAQALAVAGQADRAEAAAGKSADSATAAGQAQQGAENAKTAAVQSAADSADSAKASQDAANRAEGAAIRQPYPNPETGTWWAWDAEKGAYVDTGEVYTGNVMYGTFDIDPATGKLVMSTPDGYTGPEFAINENGELEVSVNA